AARPRSRSSARTTWSLSAPTEREPGTPKPKAPPSPAGPFHIRRAGRSGGVLRRLVVDQREDALGAVAAAQLLAEAVVAQQARHPGQRLQMVGAGVLGSQQQEDQVHRLVVDGVEVDRLFQPGEQAVDAVQ